MEHVNLTIEFKGKVHHYTAALSKYGYTYRILVKIEELEVNFEPDEEGHFRAIIDEDEKEKHKAVDVQLIQAIATDLETALS
jgi:hypothetical protein